MNHIRSICIGINDLFEVYEEEFGITLQKINVGAVADDCTGDVIDHALMKVVQNLQKILEQIEHREEEYQLLEKW